jgi:mannosyltransferase OCH1-like enzyme
MQKWFIYSLLFIIVIIILFEYKILNINTNENFDVKIENEIPLNIFQTWYTKKLPPFMQKNVDTLREKNPQFKYHLYDDDDCREFIDKYFDDSVLNAYDKLVPGAYKADLWRYCVLYIHGGIYLDMKMRCVGDFKLIEIVDKEHYVKDIESNNIEPHSFGIYNAVMIQKKKNPFLMECIQEVVKNVNNNYYGFSILYPTGPGMLGNLYQKYKYDYQLPDIDMFHVYEGEKIIYKERVILEHYPEYRREQVNNQKESHYSFLWNEQSIYSL